MRKEVSAQLMSADWGEIGTRLLAFTEWRVGHYRWKSGNSHELAQGMTPMDIVQEVIQKTLSGEREWDPDLGPLEPWLRDQVKSIVDALFKSAAHRRESLSLENPGDDESAIERLAHKQANSAPFAAQKNLTPEEHLVEKEYQQVVRERANDLFSAVSGDGELEQLMDAIMNGCEPKPRFLAEEMDVSVQDINNRIKRLRRKTLKLERD